MKNVILLHNNYWYLTVNGVYLLDVLNRCSRCSHDDLTHEQEISKINPKMIIATPEENTWKFYNDDLTFEQIKSAIQKGGFFDLVNLNNFLNRFIDFYIDEFGYLQENNELPIFEDNFIGNNLIQA